MEYQQKPHTVEAEKIVGRGELLPDGSVKVLLEGQAAKHDGTIVLKSQMPHGLPNVGDYLVTKKDGSRSVWPKEAFEEAHIVVEPETPAEESAASADDLEPDETAGDAEAEAD